jgi:nucleoside-diphosphate-sugar epimerase
MKRVLIIGCGYTGLALAHRLVSCDIEVTGTSTLTSQPGPPLNLRRLDLLAPSHCTDLSLPEAAGAMVYYMVPTLFRSYDGRSHLAPMERALTALADPPIRGLIYLSSTSVYGDHQGGWVDEHTPLSPDSPWGRMRMELEQRVWAFGQQRGLPACVVRIPEIYGPHRGPVERLRRGYTLRFPDRYSNRIHVQDLVEVLVKLGHDADQELLLVTDGHPATSREVYTYAARLMGLQLTVDEGPARGDANRLSLLRDSKRCRNTRLLEWLDTPLRYPSYREGISALVCSQEPGR